MCVYICLNSVFPSLILKCPISPVHRPESKQEGGCHIEEVLPNLSYGRIRDMLYEWTEVILSIGTLSPDNLSRGEDVALPPLAQVGLGVYLRSHRCGEEG